MSTFSDKVEQWRGLVTTALNDVLKGDPYKNVLIKALESTISDVVEVILAIISTESSGDASATGDSGNSIGLMQLNYGAGTPQGAGFTGTKEDLFNPYINVFFGSKVFLGHLEKYRNFEDAILAYNAGSVRTGSAGLPINLDYLAKVLSFLSEKKISFSPAHWRTSYTDTLSGLVVKGLSTIVDFDRDRIRSGVSSGKKDVINITTEDPQPAGDGLPLKIRIGLGLIKLFTYLKKLLFD